MWFKLLLTLSCQDCIVMRRSKPLTLSFFSLGDGHPLTWLSVTDNLFTYLPGLANMVIKLTSSLELAEMEILVCRWKFRFYEWKFRLTDWYQGYGYTEQDTSVCFGWIFGLKCPDKKYLLVMIQRPPLFILSFILTSRTLTFILICIQYYLVAVSDDTETTSDPGAPALMDRRRLGQRT